MSQNSFNNETSLLAILWYSKWFGSILC